MDLLTGRPHQVRVQLAGLGPPVVSDLCYGARAPLGDGRGIALHVVRLGVDHPTQRERMVWASPPPWLNALHEAGRAAVQTELDAARPRA